MDTTGHRRLAIAGQELRPLGRIGEGTYACVILASICKSRSNAQGPIPSGPSGISDGGLCALKIYKHKTNEVVRLAKREVVAHTRLNGHPNIVHLRGAYRSGGGRPILLMEYCPRDLQSELNQHPSGLPGTTVKLLAWQLIQAFKYMHAERFMHRDLKPTNLLLTAEGVLKVGDFGLAREAPLREPRTGGVQPGEQLTNYVVTRWYRAPEVLLNKPYGTAADIWSLGCTIAEMAIGTPLLPGRSSVDQIFQVWRMFGGLTTRSGTGAPPPPARSQQQPPRAPGMPRSSLRARLGALVKEPLVQMLEAALRTDPHERATADELLRMPYFDEIPELVAGTPLEPLYDWGTGAGAAAPPAAAAARAVSLQAAELDLPTSRPANRMAVAEKGLLQPTAVAAPPPASAAVANVASAISAGAAQRRDEGAAAGTQAAVVSSVARLRAVMAVLGAPGAAGGGEGGAPATLTGLRGGTRAGECCETGSRRPDRAGRRQDAGGRGGSSGSFVDDDDVDEDYVQYGWGLGNEEGCRVGLEPGPAHPRESHRADPRVGGGGCHAAPAGISRAGSVPVWDEDESQAAESARIAVRRTTSFGPVGGLRRRDDTGDVGDGTRNGGGGVRQPRAPTGGRVGLRQTSSIRSFFAQSRAPSALSVWGEAQWDLATAAGSDVGGGAPQGTTDVGSVAQGRLRGASTTTTTIPEDEPLFNPQPEQSRVEARPANSVPSAQPTTAAMAAAVTVVTMPAANQNHLLPASGVGLPLASAEARFCRLDTALSDREIALAGSGGGGKASDAGAAAAAAAARSTVRSNGPCRDVDSFAASGTGPAQMTELAPPLAEPSRSSAGGDGKGAAARAAAPGRALSSLSISVPPETGLSVGGPQTRAFVLRILSIIGGEPAAEAASAVAPASSAARGGNGQTSATAALAGGDGGGGGPAAAAADDDDDGAVSQPYPAPPQTPSPPAAAAPPAPPREDDLIPDSDSEMAGPRLGAGDLEGCGLVLAPAAAAPAHPALSTQPALEGASRDHRRLTPSEYGDIQATPFDQTTTGDIPLAGITNSHCTTGATSHSHVFPVSAVAGAANGSAVGYRLEEEPESCGGAGKGRHSAGGEKELWGHAHELASGQPYLPYTGSLGIGSGDLRGRSTEGRSRGEAPGAGAQGHPCSGGDGGGGGAPGTTARQGGASLSRRLLRRFGRLVVCGA